jgi:hypothetical protein
LFLSGGAYGVSLCCGAFLYRVIVFAKRLDNKFDTCLF